MLPQARRNRNERSSLMNELSPFFKETRVIADTLNGKKSGEIKFIRSAEFGEGEWIGVALDEPTGKFAVLHVIVTILGKNNGTINGTVLQ